MGPPVQEKPVGGFAVRKNNAVLQPVINYLGLHADQKKPVEMIAMSFSTEESIMDKMGLQERGNKETRTTKMK